MRQEPSVIEHDAAFVQGTLHHVVLAGIEVGHRLLQIAHPAVNQLGGTARRGRSEVPGFDQHGAESAELRVERTARAGCASSNDTDIEACAVNLSPRLGAVSHGNFARFRLAVRTWYRAQAAIVCASLMTFSRMSCCSSARLTLRTARLCSSTSGLRVACVNPVATN